MKTLELTITSIIILLLPSCEKEVPSSSAPTPPASTAKPSVAAPAPPVVAPGPVDQQAEFQSMLNTITEGSAPEFEFAALLAHLGKDLPPETLQKLKTESKSYAVLNDLLCKGSVTYSLVHNTMGGAQAFVVGSRLIAFGYSLTPLPKKGGGFDTEPLLGSFRPAGEEATIVRDVNQSPVSMTTKRYRHKTAEKLEALSYINRSSTVLAYFDSSMVEWRKFLPAPPDGTKKEGE